MSTEVLTPQIKFSYVVSIFVYALAFYVAAKVAGPVGLSVAALLAVASFALVAVSTFRWGASVGYSVIDEERRFRLEHFLRNIVMTGLVLVVLSLIGSPVFGLVFWLIAKK